MENLTSRRIIALREERDITQKELADALMINKSVLNRIELGTRSLRDDEIMKFADYFEVSADYLLGRSDIRNPYKPKVLAAHSESDEFSQADLDDIERVLEMIRKKKGKGV